MARRDILLIKYLKIYFEFVKQNLKSTLEYRADFLIGALSQIGVRLSEFIFIWTIFSNIKLIKSWSFYEVALIFGIMTVAGSLTSMFFNELWEFGVYIEKGDFDSVLLRPIPSLFHIIANKFDQNSIGSLLIGLPIVAKSFYELGLKFNAVNIFMLILFFISGTMIIAGINVILSAMSFWIRDSAPLISGVTSIQQFALYPITIFHKFIGYILTYVIPYAFVSFYPANYFLHKGYEQYAFVSPLLAVIIWGVAVRFWNFGVTRYASTGS